MDSRSERERPVPRCVLLGPYRVLNWLYKPLMKVMRERWDTRFVILLPPGVHHYEAEFRPNCGPDDWFLIAPEFLDLMETVPRAGTDVFAAARSNEQRYGISYSLDIYQQERELAWRLVAGGARTPFRRRRPMPPAALAHAANESFRFFEDLFERHAIDLALIWPRSGGEAVCAAVAGARGVLVTYPYTAKHKNYAYWATGAYCGGLQHRLAYEAAGECAALPETEAAPPARPVYLEHRKIDQRYSLLGTVKQSAAHFWHWAEFLWLDFRAGELGRTQRGNPIREARRLWSDWLYYRRFIDLCEWDTARIAARPFVFFAFQNEPEFSVQGRCKEFNDQGAIARQLALSLPVGVNLVIKEHAWIGARPLDFYKNLLALPNVIMADPGLRAIDLIPKALATASLAGTVTLEAAMFGKPALIFTERSEFAFLPSVVAVHDLGELAAILRRVTANAEAMADPYKRSAARLKKATEMIGIEADPLFIKTSTDVAPAQVERAADLLRDLMGLHAQRVAAAGALAGRLD